jgi:hypothetical protein
MSVSATREVVSESRAPKETVELTEDGDEDHGEGSSDLDGSHGVANLREGIEGIRETDECPNTEAGK